MDWPARQLAKKNLIYPLPRLSAFPWLSIIWYAIHWVHFLTYINSITHIFISSPAAYCKWQSWSENWFDKAHKRQVGQNTRWIICCKNFCYAIWLDADVIDESKLIFSCLLCICDLTNFMSCSQLESIFDIAHCPKSLIFALKIQS